MRGTRAAAGTHHATNPLGRESGSSHARTRQAPLRAVHMDGFDNPTFAAAEKTPGGTEEVEEALVALREIEAFAEPRAVAAIERLIAAKLNAAEHGRRLGSDEAPAEAAVRAILIPAPSFELAQTRTVGAHGCWDYLAGVPASSNVGFALGGPRNGRARQKNGRGENKI